MRAPHNSAHALRLPKIYLLRVQGYTQRGMGSVMRLQVLDLVRYALVTGESAGKLEGFSVLDSVSDN